MDDDVIIFPAMETIVGLSPIHRNIIARANELGYFPMCNQVKSIQLIAGHDYYAYSQHGQKVKAARCIDQAIEKVMNKAAT